MNLKKIKKEWKSKLLDAFLCQLNCRKDAKERYNKLMSYFKQTITQVVESVPVKLPQREAFQEFPRKDNPVKCRLCGEKTFCSCIYGFEEHVQQIKQWKKEILKELLEKK